MAGGTNQGGRVRPDFDRIKKKVPSKYLLLLDHDCSPPPDFLLFRKSHTLAFALQHYHR